MSLRLFCFVVAALVSAVSCAQNPINWTEKQLMEPAELAAAIKENKNLPTIISIGPGSTIPYSTHIGMVNDKEGLSRLRTLLDKLPKDDKIVIYCGCCPFEHCPNVRPAISALKEKKFTNYFLLNIPKNMKTNWIDQGYPVAGG